jgi:3-methyladenine DNA glycosylase AlkC
MATIAPDRLQALEAGLCATTNLVEGLAINMPRLLTAIAPKLPQDGLDTTLGITQRMRQIGALLRAHQAAHALAAHPSDTVRGWVAFAIGQDPSLAPMARLEAMRPFAADRHFGVREWAWLAVRSVIVEQPLAAIATLTPWTHATDANLRRFACEATRPRGVWAAAIPLLRQAPMHGLPIIAALRYDPAE